MTHWKIISTGLLLAATACATPQFAQKRPSAPCPAEINSISSAAGSLWWQANRWRFGSDEEATKAYRKLAGGASPWPDWYVPYDTVLAPGTRFQMAIGGAQTPETPGNFGTFDDIQAVADVRDHLAVRVEWKPQVDRVVIYEVVTPVPVKIGPVGPQVDPANCTLLEGRWSQFQANVERGTLINYLKVIEVRPIR